MQESLLFPGYVVKGLAQIKREEGALKTSISINDTDVFRKCIIIGQAMQSKSASLMHSIILHQSPSQRCNADREWERSKS